MEGMVVCSANYVPLTPLSFLERAAFVYGERVSVIFGSVQYSWRETKRRCIKLASALSQLGITPGDIVAAVAPNIPELYELHFAVPMAGAVLSLLNTRLNATTMALKLKMLEPKAMFVDYELIEVVQEALDLLSQNKITIPFLVLIQEHSNPTRGMNYDTLLANGKDNFEPVYPKSECDPISVCFTSGSTGKPKGVIYSHRATYLKSVGESFRIGHGNAQPPVFLWTVDMFRCNGWCFPWTMAALGGTNICLRHVTGRVIFDSIFIHNVTHFCGAPTLVSKIAEVAETLDPNHPQQLPNKVNVTVAGAGPLPESRVLAKLERLGFIITCSYGMTEALGPVTSRILQFQKELSNDKEATVKIREGMHNLLMEGADVKDPVTMESVAADGKTIGEVMFRSNSLMLGYMKNARATEAAFREGWYRTRDLGVKHPDGYIQMKDRRADAITSGGEIISSLEIEEVIVRHPMVLDAAVVAKPDHFLGEIPCAFVELEEGCSASALDIKDFCAAHLPENMRPKHVFLQELPRNSTGKIQKFVLRECVRETRD